MIDASAAFQAGEDHVSSPAMDENDKIMAAAVDEALTALRARYGTYAAAAKELDVTRQALTDWRVKGRVSHLRVRRVAELTGIPLDRLRPDLYESA